MPTTTDTLTNSIHGGLFLSHYDFTEKEFYTVKSCRTLRIVKDKLREFDRQTCEIVCASGTIIPYDLLVFATGRQYTIPKPLKTLPSFPKVVSKFVDFYCYLRLV